jgi:hypothetical protein
MGYNPYICVICGYVKDNGWFKSDGLWYDARVDDVLNRLGKDMCPFSKESIMTCDVCDVCFNIGKKLKKRPGKTGRKRAKNKNQQF